MKKVKFFILLAMFALPVSACTTEAENERKLAEFEASFEEAKLHGEVVSQTEGMTFTPGNPSSTDEMRKTVKNQCISNVKVTSKASCDNLETVDNANGTVTIQYKVK